MNAPRKSVAAKPKPKPKAQGRAQKNAQAHLSFKNQTSSILTLPFELQQLILDIFKNSFPERNGEDLISVLQEIKGHLYNRDFAKAFGKDEYLEAYAVRWSPSRALGYLKIFDSVIREFCNWIEELDGDADSTLKVACLGGGAGAEIVGLAGAMGLKEKAKLKDIEARLQQLNVDDPARQSGLGSNIEAVFVDIASWKIVIDKLYHNITTAPPLSAYASAAAKAANKPLISSSSFKFLFRQTDVLALKEEELRNIVAGRSLITIFFTLNELYSTSMPKTQSFLLQLTRCVSKASLFLVVDSAGSYSTISLNGKEKKYPMHWLLDHALLKSNGSGSGSGSTSTAEKWEKLQETESEWFRIPEGLNYPLELENMRYQLHLYRRL
jgi:25S rRNA (uracil2843-N3)-methyltransferase